MTTMTVHSNLLTASQAARELGLSVNQVRNLASQGRLRTAMFTPLGKLFSAEDVHDLKAIRAAHD